MRVRLLRGGGEVLPRRQHHGHLGRAKRRLGLLGLGARTRTAARKASATTLENRSGATWDAANCAWGGGTTDTVTKSGCGPAGERRAWDGGFDAASCAWTSDPVLPKCPEGGTATWEAATCSYDVSSTGGPDHGCSDGRVPAMAADVLPLEPLRDRAGPAGRCAKLRHGRDHRHHGL